MEKIRKNKKWIIMGSVLLAVVLLVALMARGCGAAASAAGRTLSTAVERGSITSTVIGSGSLQYGEKIDLLLPVDLKVDKVYVEAGDYVAKGDVIATFDPASIQTRIEALTDEIKDVDSDINSKKGETASSYVTAHVSGRVKAIYATEGADTADVIAAHGALMVLSIDGKMAVRFSCEKALAAGATLRVTLADGSETEGLVESSKSGQCVVTLTDNGPKPGETVTVADGDGNKLGAGTLYVHQPISIIGSAGKIKDIRVSVNSWVGSGTTLATLEDVAFSAAYQELLTKRAQLSDALANLVVISKTGSLVASFSGVVDAISIQNGTTTSSSSLTSGGGSSGVDLSGLTGFGGLSADGGDSAVVTAKAGSGGASIQLLGAGTTATITDAMLLTDLFTAGFTPPVTGGAIANPITVNGNATAGTLTWNTTDMTFQPETVYTANVVLFPNDGYAYAPLYTPSLSTLATITDSKIQTLPPQAGALTFTATFPATAAQQGGGFDIPDWLNGLDDLSGLEGLFDLGGLSGFSGLGGLSGYGSAISGGSVAGDYQMIALTVSSGETMSLVIDVDQLDINSIQKGQSAAVVFDAISGQTFQGVITKISDSTSSSSSSGVARYKVTVSLPRAESMRAGMYATATITVNEKTGILTLPADAVQEAGGRVFAYTESDGKGGLSGEREVITGLSDGISVEILEGLAEGDTVYYTMKVSNPYEMFMLNGGFE